MPRKKEGEPTNQVKPDAGPTDIEFVSVAKDVGLVQSRLDPCMFFCRDNGALTGILVIHVDDVITGGRGDHYEEIIKILRARLRFRQ